MLRLNRLVLMLAGAVAITVGACSPPPPKRPSPQGPPPAEAIEACKGLADGASCTAEVNGRSTEGTCRKGPDSSAELACMPPHPPGGGHGGPHGGPPGAPPNGELPPAEQ